MVPGALRFRPRRAGHDDAVDRRHRHRALARRGAHPSRGARQNRISAPPGHSTPRADCCSALLFAACAYPASALFEEPRLFGVMLALGFSVLLGGLDQPAPDHAAARPDLLAGIRPQRLAEVHRLRRRGGDRDDLSQLLGAGDRDAGEPGDKRRRLLSRAAVPAEDHLPAYAGVLFLLRVADGRPDRQHAQLAFRLSAGRQDARRARRSATIRSAAIWP